MDTDDLTTKAYQTILIACEKSPLFGAQLAVAGRSAETEDEFLHTMLAHVEEALEDVEDEVDWLADELTAKQLRALCVRLQKHIHKTLATPISRRGKPPFE